MDINANSNTNNARIPERLSDLNRPPRREACHTLNEREARQVFDLLEDEFRPTWNKPSENCHNRAHMFQQMLGYLEPWSLWVLPTDSRSHIASPLKDIHPADRDRVQECWQFHVAPTVPVKTDTGDVIETVLDPALFDGPVSAAQWARAFSNVGPEQLVHAPADESPAKAYEPFIPMVKILDLNWRDRDGQAERNADKQAELPPVRYERLKAPDSLVESRIGKLHARLKTTLARLFGQTGD